MTELGLYFAKKSVNKSEIARRTGISKSRLSELSMNSTSRLRADELYLIALAIDTDAAIMLEYLFKNLKLKG
jgi:transcriptional regulator with XRE-family HTH domain